MFLINARKNIFLIKIQQFSLKKRANFFMGKILKTVIFSSFFLHFFTFFNCKCINFFLLFCLEVWMNLEEEGFFLRIGKVILQKKIAKLGGDDWQKNATFTSGKGGSTLTNSAAFFMSIFLCAYIALFNVNLAKKGHLRLKKNWDVRQKIKLTLKFCCSFIFCYSWTSLSMKTKSPSSCKNTLQFFMHKKTWFDPV